MIRTSTEAKNSLQDFFTPSAVAIIGATEEPGKIGSGLVKSIRRGFAGAYYCVNPKHTTLWGQPCYSSVLEISAPVSHAVIAVSRNRVLSHLRECAQAGIRNVVVISSGFKETDEAGAALEQEMTRFCLEEGITLLGPNTLGFINTSISYNGTFLPADRPRGSVSVISQSGGVGMALLDALQDQCCGIAKWAGIGNEAVVDAAALLSYLAEDEDTAAIAVCFEGLKNLPEFLRLAGRVSRKKPVVLLRDGKSSVGQRAAASHTGALAQSDKLISDLAAQFGLLEAQSCRQCAVMVKALALAPKAAGLRTVILTNTAGPSILAADAMEPRGVLLPQPSQALQDAVDQAVGLSLQLKNPSDISSNGLQPENYGSAAKTLLSSDEYDILLGFFSLNEHLSLPDKEIIAAAQSANKPAVACFLCSAEELRRYDHKVERHGIPCFCDSEDAANAVIALTHYRSGTTTEPAIPDRLPASAYEAAAELLERLQGRSYLSEADSKELLALAGLPVSIPRLASAKEEAMEAAELYGYPVALKLQSNVITHKTDVGGVRLGIQSPAELADVFDDMLSAMRALDSDAALAVEPMAKPGFELILGAVRTPGVGTVLMAGAGGVYAEVFQDTAFALPPASDSSLMKVLSSMRCAQILRGFRGSTLDQEAAVRCLQALSRLMAVFPEIREIEINPCRVYEHGISILDARVVLETL